MVKRNGETVEYQVALNIPHLRGKINKTCANRPISCVNGEKPSDFGSDKEPAYRCVAALGRRACPLSLAPLASSPKGGAIGRPGHFLLDARAPIWRKRAGLATEGSGFWTSAPCQAAVSLDSGALPFPRYCASLVQTKADRHANGSPFGGAVTEGD